MAVLFAPPPAPPPPQFPLVSLQTNNTASIQTNIFTVLLKQDCVDPENDKKMMKLTKKNMQMKKEMIYLLSFDFLRCFICLFFLSIFPVYFSPVFVLFYFFCLGFATMSLWLDEEYGRNKLRMFRSSCHHVVVVHWTFF